MAQLHQNKLLRLWPLLGLLLISCLLLACKTAEPTPPGSIHIIKIDGAIGPITERYVDRVFKNAELNKASLIIIELNTPGGVSSTTREIVQHFYQSSIPIAVYVSPAGGRAASAGTFLTLAAHIAAMAPNTSIGAAASVNVDGSDMESTLASKVENDSVSFIRGAAELRGRNADWAELAVRKAVSITQNEALKLNVIDIIAVDINELVAQSNDREIIIKPGTSTFLTNISEAPRIYIEKTQWEKVLELISNPTLATILLSLGFLALVFELSNPGLFLPGVSGVIAIVVGFLAFGTLPVETAGLVLLGAALVFLLLELLVTSGGILGAGGVVALILGIIITFRETPTDLQPNKIVAAILIFILATLFISITIGLARLRKQTTPTGAEALIGRIAEVRTPLEPRGMVFLEGELWKAEITTGAATAGEQVAIVESEGLQLKVSKMER
jgi:membrane-bound serine protease (ClpP class)